MLVLLSMLSIMMFGARGWILGTDRACCILDLSNIQKSVRSYQNLYGYAPGDLAPIEGQTRSISEHLYAREFISEHLYELLTGGGACPTGGLYEVAVPTVFPADGALFAQCSLADSEDHVPPPLRGGSW